jgi:hypothetical protein
MPSHNEEFGWLLRNPPEAIEYVRSCQRMGLDLDMCPTIAEIEQLCACVASNVVADRSKLLDYLDRKRQRYGTGRVA